MSRPARLVLAVGISLLLWEAAGCQYYEDFRVKKTSADLKEEQAALLRDYRQCLEKYQDTPPKAKEFCAPYTQRLQEIKITR